MEMIETPIFTRQVTTAMDDDEYRLFQLHLLQRPDAGAVIRGSSGLRKCRWRLLGRGKRGGVRVIYSWRQARARLFLLFLYPKNVRSDLTPAQLRVLRKLIADE
jgi:hypothetical protein